MESREKVAAIFGAGKRGGLKDKKTAAESCRGNYHWRDAMFFIIPDEQILIEHFDLVKDFVHIILCICYGASCHHSIN